MVIKHVSFDVWNTLISANPDFAKARTDFLSAYLQVPATKVNEVYRKLKDWSDRRAESHGESQSSESLYKALLFNLDRQDMDWKPVQLGLELAFANHPPTFLPETRQVLKAIQDKGLTLSIGSNTNFIRGAVLRDVVLDGLGVDWDYWVFSDEQNVSKPHERFWRTVWGYADENAHWPSEVLHVGDNLICDGGCQKYGIQFQHVNGPAELARVLERL